MATTALIIEDDKLSASVLKQLLARESIDSMTLIDTFVMEAELAKASRPDVIFLDLELPNLNGYDILRLIRANATFDGVPVIAYTTHISHLNDTRMAGFNGFLGKPLDPGEFPTQIQRILSGESVWEAS